MNRSKISSLVLACTVLVGCHKSIHSISNPVPAAARTGHPGPDTDTDPAFAYRGELCEFDILGITRDDLTSESDIQRALDQAKRVRLRANSSILLIQSGAAFPDGAMVSELSRHFAVVPFSGLPPVRQTRSGWRNDPSDPEGYSKSLRLAAARGGNDFIVCYWGILESESQRLPTKTVSWVPLVTWIIPDEVQRMRIRVKLALVDVRSGNWTILSPKAFETDRASTRPGRGAVDQKQVERLKQKAYEACVKDLVAQHADLALAK